jgi:NADH-quinone oxidoreductase subunit L
LLGVITASLTAFYVFRVLFVAFYGRPRMSRKEAGRIHESPMVMVIPLVVLAALSALGGFVGLPEVLGLGNAIDQFLHPVFADSYVLQPEGGGAAAEWLLMLASVVAAGAGIFAAYWIYIRNWGLAERMTKGAGRLYDLVYNKYYVDELYREALVNPLLMLGNTLASAVERKGIDAAVNGLGQIVAATGEGLRRLQSGLVRNYALAMMAGLVAILAFLLLRSWLGT